MANGSSYEHRYRAARARKGEVEMGGLDKTKDSVEPKDTKSLPFTPSKRWNGKSEEYRRGYIAGHLKGVTGKSKAEFRTHRTVYVVCPICKQLQDEVTDLASNNPEAIAELSNPPKESL